ncbi:MAG TPA: OB-fold nucleic acid binding domain-containing protein, partial [Alphaproteobacteria bacterium]|nr:OB-fold nucleic acid binding domain-containing protein [Alphaproteobacteria bacterium]
GVIFMTIEDETGHANAIVWSKAFERYRRVVIGSRLILIRGRVQRQGVVIHVVAEHLEDWSPLLWRLAEDDCPAPPEASRKPVDGVAQTAMRKHPRDVRIIPKSRDFH